jgi:hypothetical protein
MGITLDRVPPPSPTAGDAELPPEERRHRALLRMLGHVKDALHVDPRVIYRAAALGGYNANPDPAVGNADPGIKALWAEADAEAMLAVGSDENPTKEG